MSESRTKRLPQQHAPATPPQPTAAEAPTVATAAPPVTAAPGRTMPPPRPAGAGCIDPFAAFDAARAAFTGSTVAVADEMADMMRVGIDSATDAATGLLTAKTLSDGFAVNARLASRNVDAALARSLRLTELGTRLATEAWEKLMPMFGTTSAR
ncbi:MAG TPA: phasin family protein [Stellaceae bacterium]|nr:phasin family protein [Stellaceae bacterium]